MGAEAGLVGGSIENATGRGGLFRAAQELREQGTTNYAMDAMG